jgi:hypothetical protein
MFNYFRVLQWKTRLAQLQYFIKKERERIVYIYGNDAINNLELSTHLHDLYKKADEIMGNIINENYPQIYKKQLY